MLLRFDGISDRAGATVHYSVSGPARLVRQDATPLPWKASVSREVDVAVDPSAAGRAYLNVFTAQNASKGVVSILVGGQQAAQLKQGAGAVRRSSSGELLVIVPAQTRP
ncbi:hypothetical protein WG922_19430 [Ramlibacter sp. AN1015]|uniref:hypothetical protein n=1 Tax=Ramlibacter sp. AN1015 TaxID=3133428 RepID=UPI0030C1C16C